MSPSRSGRLSSRSKLSDVSQWCGPIARHQAMSNDWEMSHYGLATLDIGALLFAICYLLIFSYGSSQ